MVKDTRDDELENYFKFLRDLTESVRELYGELTVYRLMYGQIPYTKDGKKDIRRMWSMAESAEPLQAMLYEASQKARNKNV